MGKARNSGAIAYAVKDGAGGVKHWRKILAAALVAVAVVILAYAVLTPEPDVDSTDHPGMWDEHMTYSSANVGLIAVSIVVIVAALMIVILWQDYEPLSPAMAPPPPVQAHLAAGPPAKPGADAAVQPRPPQTAEEKATAEAAHNYLVLRLLTGDERLMFKTIMDSNGEALQKDLILRTKMSNAKVSRLLDRLLEKGLITKERYGATNKVKIKLRS